MALAASFMPGAAAALAGTGWAAQAGAATNDSDATQVNDFLVFMSEWFKRYGCPGDPRHARRVPHGIETPGADGKRFQPRHGRVAGIAGRKGKE